MFEVDRSAVLIDEMCVAACEENRAIARRLVKIGSLFEMRREEHGEEKDYAVDTWAEVGAEIAAALRCSLSMAGSYMHYARAMRDRLPRVGAVFEAGDIDYRTFQAISYRTELIEDEQKVAAAQSIPAATATRNTNQPPHRPTETNSDRCRTNSTKQQERQQTQPPPADSKDRGREPCCQIPRFEPGVSDLRIPQYGASGVSKNLDTNHTPTARCQSGCSTTAIPARLETRCPTTPSPTPTANHHNNIQRPQKAPLTSTNGLAGEDRPGRPSKVWRGEGIGAVLRRKSPPATPIFADSTKPQARANLAVADQLAMGQLSACFGWSGSFWQLCWVSTVFGESLLRFAVFSAVFPSNNGKSQMRCVGGVVAGSDRFLPVDVVVGEQLQPFSDCRATTGHRCPWRRRSASAKAKSALTCRTGYRARLTKCARPRFKENRAHQLCENAPGADRKS